MIIMELIKTDECVSNAMSVLKQPIEIILPHTRQLYLLEFALGAEATMFAASHFCVCIFETLDALSKSRTRFWG